MNSRSELDEKFSAQFFNGRAIGRSLKEMAVDVVKSESDDVTSRWYHAPRTDLFTWTDKKNNIIKQQLQFNGQVVEWNCLEGIKTGLLIEADLGLKATYNDQGKMNPDRFSESIRFDPKPMGSCVQLALEIVENAEFEKATVGQLVLNFKDPQNIQTMTPEDFLQRFGGTIRKHGALKLEPGLFDTIKTRLRKLLK